MLIRVFEMPEMDVGFCFSGAKPHAFLLVDWFRDEAPNGGAPKMTTEKGRKQIEKFVKSKSYYNPGSSYLILHESNSITINYSAP